MTLMLWMVVFNFFNVLRIVTMTAFDTVTMVFIRATTAATVVLCGITPPAKRGAAGFVFFLIGSDEMVTVTQVWVLTINILVTDMVVVFLTQSGELIMTAFFRADFLQGMMVVLMGVHVLTGLARETEFSLE